MDRLMDNFQSMNTNYGAFALGSSPYSMDRKSPWMVDTIDPEEKMKKLAQASPSRSDKRVSDMFSYSSHTLDSDVVSKTFAKFADAAKSFFEIFKDANKAKTSEIPESVKIAQHILANKSPLYAAEKEKSDKGVEAPLSPSEAMQVPGIYSKALFTSETDLLAEIAMMDKSQNAILDQKIASANVDESEAEKEMALADTPEEMDLFAEAAHRDMVADLTEASARSAKKAIKTR